MTQSAGSTRRASVPAHRCAIASRSTHTTSSIEIAFAHRIFGVGHTFSNVSELLSSARAIKAPATRRHFWVGDADGIFAEYGTRFEGHPAARGAIGRSRFDGRNCTVSSQINKSRCAFKASAQSSLRHCRVTSSIVLVKSLAYKELAFGNGPRATAVLRRGSMRPGT